METNEKLKIALLQETEKELLKMIDQGETIQEGDLQTLEQSVLRACLCLGRTMLEQIVTHAEEEAERPSRREGECGQKPRLVGIRPKQLHTLMGKVTIGRSYYQCVVEEEEATNPRGYMEACAALREADLRAALADIHIPSLIIAGGLDESTPLSQARELHAAITGSELMLLPEAAHLSNVEQPEEFSKAVLDFLVHS